MSYDFSFFVKDDHRSSRMRMRRFCLSCEEMMRGDPGCRYTRDVRKRIAAVYASPGSTDHVYDYFSVDEIDLIADMEREISLHEEEHWVELSTEKLS